MWPQVDLSQVISQLWSLSLKFRGTKLRLGPASWLAVLPKVRPIRAGDIWTAESPILSGLYIGLPFLSSQSTVFYLSKAHVAEKTGHMVRRVIQARSSCSRRVGWMETCLWDGKSHFHRIFNVSFRFCFFSSSTFVHQMY